MLIRTNNVFILNSHIIKFELAWREGRMYLDIETAPRALDGGYSQTDWAFLTAYQVPEGFDLELFLNNFWREVRQGRPIDLANLVDEVAREASSRELMEV